MRRCWVVLLIGACGRFDFDPIGTAGDAATIGDPDLVVWLEMNDAPAPQVADSSGYGHHGVCVTTCPTVTPAIRGHGFHFDGVANAIEIADVPELRLPQGTAATWVRLDALPAAGTAVSMITKPFGPTDQDSFEIFVDTSNGLTIGGDTVVQDYVAFAIAADVWHHVAITWDGDTLSGYLDGTPRMMTGFSMSYDAHPTMVGHDSDNGVRADFIQGTLDDVRIYRRALTAAEIGVLATP